MVGNGKIITVLSLYWVYWPEQQIARWGPLSQCYCDMIEVEAVLALLLYLFLLKLHRSHSLRLK